MTITAMATTRRMNRRASCLIPLAVLAVGAVFAGIVFRHFFIGGGYEGFWKGALFLGPDNHILEEMENGALAGLAACRR